MKKGFTATAVAKSAFTLAEVLITLAIIGVVASMTIPNMLHDSWKEQAETSLKKVYMTWTNAIQLAEREHGPIDSWVINTPEEFYNKLSYQEGEHRKNFVNLIQCEGSKDTKCKIRGYHTMNSKPESLNENIFPGWSNRKNYDFITTDGMSYALNFAKGGGQDSRVIAVDINGNKGPNTIGMDLFYFIICPGLCNCAGGVYCSGSANTSNGFYPAGIGRTDKGGTGTYGCSRTNSSYLANMYCAYRIMSNGWQVDY